MKRYSVFMRIIKCLAFCWVLQLLSFEVKAQFPEFYTHFVKGQVFVKKAGKKWLPMKQKDLLFKEDMIEIRQDNMEAHLVDKDGNFIVLKTKGIYRSGDLHKQVVKKTTGITQKYFALLWKDLNEPELKMPHLTVENLTGSWGGPGRGDSACDLLVFPQYGECISNDTLTFSWKKSGSASSYNFILMNERRNEMFNFITHDTSVTAIVGNMKNSDKTMLYWTVNPVGQNCATPERAMIYLLTKNEESKIISTVLSTVKQEDPLIYHLEVADQLAKKGLTGHAVKYLNKAMGQ